MDVAVIILFAICLSLADSLINAHGFAFSSIAILFAELVVSLGLGAGAGEVGGW